MGAVPLKESDAADVVRFSVASEGAATFGSEHAAIATASSRHATRVERRVHPVVAVANDSLIAA
jgi:hypothetical protein